MTLYGIDILDKYPTHKGATADLSELEEAMSDKYCPLTKELCKRNCMFRSSGVVSKAEKGYQILIPVCSARGV